jgi:HK97 family phage major capsid protein
MESKETIAPEPTAEELGRRERSAIAAEVAGLLEEREQAWQERQVLELQELRKPDRSKVPDLYETPKPHSEVVKLRSPNEYLYARMPEEVRAIRNPDSDHWMAEEFRGFGQRNQARIFQAQCELATMFGRASTLEGAAGASGALSAGTGGPLISRPIEQLVLIARDKVAKMLRFAAGFTMTKQTHTVPTANAMTTYQVAEGGTTTQGEPTYAGVQLSAVKTAARGVVSLEMLADADINIVGGMTTLAGRALGAAQEAQFWRTGDGTAPNISAFAAGTAFAEATSAELKFTDVVNMYYTCPQVYRDMAAWYAEASVLQAMVGVRDGNGRAFYQGLTERPGPLSDDPTAVGTILGKPVYEVDATAGTIHFGDMNACYLVGQRQGIMARTSEHAQFAAGLVEFIWEQRYDGNNVDTSAVQSCTGITSANSL